MEKVKFKAGSPRALGLKIYEMVAKGWAIVKHPRKNWFGVWSCKMKKIKKIS